MPELTPTRPQFTATTERRDENTREQPVGKAESLGVLSPKLRKENNSHQLSKTGALDVHSHP